MASSLIYRSIYFYRLAMEMLYSGRYRARFFAVCRHIRGERITELCFGDILIARYCKRKNWFWQGIDLNANFVRHALSQEYKAHEADIRYLSSFPSADTCIISGSLYQFRAQLDPLFFKMLAAAPFIIISEPVINLSSRSGLIANLARGSSTINNEKHFFRFSEDTLIAEIKRLSEKLNFTFQVKEHFTKDLIITIER